MIPENTILLIAWNAIKISELPEIAQVFQLSVKWEQKLQENWLDIQTSKNIPPLSVIKVSGQTLRRLGTFIISTMDHTSPVYREYT